MAGEKRFEPSRKKLERARQNGDIAKSHVLSIAFAFLVGVAAIVLRAPRIASEVTLFYEAKLGGGKDFQSNNMLVSLQETTLFALRQLLPLLSAVWLALLLAETAQVGVMFSWDVLHWKWSRVSFLSGFRRIFGYAAESKSSLPLGLLYEAAKYLALLAGCGALATLMFFYCAGSLAHADLMESSELGMLFVQLVLRILAPVGAALFLLGSLDLLIASQRRRRRLRMDLEEMRRDLRESEGDAETKAMRKQQHQELLMHGVLEGVRKASVIVLGRRESGGESRR